MKWNIPSAIQQPKDMWSAGSVIFTRVKIKKQNKTQLPPQEKNPQDFSVLDFLKYIALVWNSTSVLLFNEEWHSLQGHYI